MLKYFIFLCCFISFSATAQNIVNKQSRNFFEQAQVSIGQQKFDEGINFLNEAVKLDPNFQLAYIQLGDIYSRKKSHQKAKESYLKAIKSQNKTEARIYFSLGENELLVGEYDKAKLNFDYFKQNYLGSDSLLIHKNNKYILDCEFALKAIKNPSKYQPVNMGENINSSNREYFPALTADGESIIFTRVVNGNEDFFTSYKKDGKWLVAQPLSNQINTKNFNEGAQSISPDGKYLFFTGCNRPDGLGKCDIYISRKDGNNWDKATNLGSVINSEYWESQPAISPDGNTLYFVSNRRGGFGGYDIWKSTLSEKNGWTVPVNLGPKINTPYDENTPFMHADGKTLYFSSDGWPGLGDKDFFYSRLDNQGEFSYPLNLGYPINSYNEEIGLTVSADGNEGLFSSNNKESSYGDLDIYSFKLPEKYKPLPVTYLKGIVKDRITMQLLDASVLAIDLLTDKAVFNDFTSKETGDFLVVMPLGSKYSFNVIADGYLFNSLNFSLDSINQSKPYEIEIFLDPIKVGNSVALQNIFFDTNKYDLLPSSTVELSFLVDFLVNNGTIAIELQGHTDNVGEDKLNDKLSENRAKSVYDYLISNGIDKKRLTYKGYGATKPRTDNSTEDGRKQNRRTEFIITHI